MPIRATWFGSAASFWKHQFVSQFRRFGSERSQRLVAPQQRQIMRRRLKIVLLMLAATMLISFPIFENPGPVLLCNASASAPVGLYRVRSIDKLRAAELDVARPPAPLANLLREGGYLPVGVPLIKRVLGLAGQTICRADVTVTVDAST
jgi:type IV secretory pathway protease TraF